MRGRFPLARKNRVEMSVGAKKLHKIWLGSCESVGKRSRWHRVHRKIEVGEANGSSKRKQVLSLSCLRNNLAVEQDPSTMVTLFWATGVWRGRWRKDQQKARKKQISEAQTWRQVRGPKGAVVSYWWQWT